MATSVPRQRLLTRLDRIPPGGTGLLVAPAGSGKSVLLEQWAAAHPELGSCSVDLTPQHNDPVALAAAIVSGLERAGVRVDPQLAAKVAPGGESLGPAAVASLQHALQSHEDRLLLVLDDAHLLRSPALVAELGELALDLPSLCRLVVSSRWDVGLPVRDLRLAGRVVELRAADLAFGPDEGIELLERVSGCDLAADDAATLVARTEGWAVGLQLAAISLRSADDPTSFVQEFAGTDRLVVEYLTEEVLARQKPEVQEFLLDTSVLPWLSAELCDAVTDLDDGRSMLRHLLESSLFVIPLDRRGERYRYHHLVADLLRSVAGGRDPQRQRAARRRAADWFVEHGRVHEAVDQLLASEQWADAAELVRAHAQDHYERGESATLVSWLGAIERGYVDAPVSIGIDLLAAEVASNRFVRAAETHRRLGRRDDVTPGQRVAADALYACAGLDHLPADTVIDLSSEVLRSLSGLEEAEVADFLGVGGAASVRTMSGFMMAIAHFRSGRLDTAADVLEWVTTTEGMEYPLWRVNTLGAQALVRAWQGHLRQAVVLADRALAAADEVHLQQHPATCIAHLALAAVAYQRHEPDQMSRALQDAAARIDGRGRVLRDLLLLLEVRRAALVEGPRRAVELLGDGVADGSGAPIVAGAVVVEVRSAISSGEVGAARVLLDAAVPSTWLAPARIELELAVGDLRAAEHELARWHIDVGQPAQIVEHGVLRCELLAASGDVDAAIGQLHEVLAVAEVEGLRRPLLDRRPVMRLVAASVRRRPDPFLQSLVNAERTASALNSGQSRLVDPLTDRELSVLEYLPTRMTNQEIASTLHLSVNTVKTHLRNIYRKLEAPDRDAAVETASELGVLRPVGG